MSRINDRAYLQTRQYKNSANLAARIELHRRFSTNTYGWLKWVYDQLNLQPGTHLLEVGGGPGMMWRDNLKRLPDDLSVCLSDFSPGMVGGAKGALGFDSRFTFVNTDVQAIPFQTDTFDIVIANHMLYHVPDLPRAVRELGRVLKYNGRLYAATNGLNHMRELHALVAEFDPDNAPAMAPNIFAQRFGLENGPEILGREFARVETRHYEDTLWVTDAEALTNYATSLDGMGRFGNFDQTQAKAFSIFAAQKMKTADGIHILKEAGVIIGYKES